MKSSTIVLIAIVLVAVASAAPVENLDSKWEDFKKSHHKNYESPEEESRRKDIFRQHLEGIEAHNKKFEAGKVTFKQGINEFSDLTKEEISTRLGLKPNPDHKVAVAV